MEQFFEFASRWVAWILLFGGVSWRLLVWLSARPKWADNRLTNWVEAKKARAQERELLAVVLKEFRPNGGSTMRDSANRTEAALARVETELGEAKVERFTINARLGGLLSVTDDAYWQSDTTGFITWVNPYLCELFGQSEGKLLGHEWKNSVHPDDYAKVTSRWSDAVRDGRSYEGTHRVIREDGGVVSVYSHARPMRDSTNNIIGWFGCVMEQNALAKSSVAKSSVAGAFAANAPATPCVSRPPRLLWVEDGGDLRTVIPLHLRALAPSIEVCTAATARDAMQQLDDARELGKPFGFVILDFNLPEINGMELAKKLREIEAQSGHTPVRLAFCTGAPDDALARDDIAALRVEVVLPKPIDWNAVAAFLGR